MPLLYFWRGDNYLSDLDNGVAYHLNQNNPLLHEIELGDSLWAFTRRTDGVYVLAAELKITAKTINPAGFLYGQYRVWGDLHNSRYFQIANQPSIEPLVRGFSVNINASILGQSFQGRAAVKKMTIQDHLYLTAFASDLPLEPRARILPESELEKLVYRNGTEDINRLIRETNPGIGSARREYLIRQVPLRNPIFVKQLHAIYKGKCQICLWDPVNEYGRNICEGHHLQWLSRGGEDSLMNMVLICPNHHSAIHACDAHLDYLDLSFNFLHHRETINLNLHLPQN